MFSPFNNDMQRIVEKLKLQKLYGKNDNSFCDFDVVIVTATHESEARIK